MADLIDRDVFILSLKERRAKAYLSELYDCDTEAEKQRIDDEMYYSTQSFIDVLMREPAVNAVHVVRCKDCRYAEYTHDTKGRPCYDTIYCERNDLQAIANWFCADGRKKDGDSDESD